MADKEQVPRSPDSPNGGHKSYTASNERQSQDLLVIKQCRDLLTWALKDAGATIDGDHVKCPFHNDCQASGSIHNGTRDGAYLYTCHACEWNYGKRSGDVVAIVQRSKGIDFRAASERVVYREAAPAITAYARRLRLKTEGGWRYEDAEGSTALIVVRFNGTDGKQYRPFHRGRNGWAIGDSAGVLPLYGLSELSDAKRVYVVEGEKCVEAAREIGLTATTSAHGAKGAKKTDWSPLAGRDVVILPDNDDAGRKYAEDVASIVSALNPPARAKIVRLPDLPEKGDIADFLAARDTVDQGTVRQELDALADETAMMVTGASILRNDDTPKSRFAVTVSLSDVEPEAVRWLWPQRIPLGKLTILVGDPGVGKSFITLDIAAHVSTGSPWPDIPDIRNKPSKVVILSAEDDLADTIRPRLDAAGADTKNIVAITAIKERGKDGESYFSLDRDLPALEKVIAEEKARLVIVDPITAYLGKTDSHNNADVRGLLAPLAAMAARHDCAILAVTHLNKNEKGKAIYRAMGSLAFLAAARAAWFLGKDPDSAERRLLLPLKANVIEKPVGIAFRIADGRVEWAPSPIHTDPDTLMATQGKRGASKANRVKAWLCTTLAHGPVPVKELENMADQVGHAWRTVQRVRAELGVVARREGFGKDGAWVWELPGDRGPPAGLAAFG